MLGWRAPIDDDMPRQSPLPDHTRTRELTHLFELDSNTKDRLAGVLKFATHHSGSPIAVIAVQDELGQWYNASLGLHLTTPTVHQVFCARVILHSAPLEVGNATEMARLARESGRTIDIADSRSDAPPHVGLDSQIGSYFGVPLDMPKGGLVGSLAVMAPHDRTLDMEGKRMLKALAQQVVRLFAGVRVRPASQRAIGEFDYQPYAFDSPGDGLVDALDSYLEEASDDDEPTNIAALFFDLDSFRLVHQTLGRSAANRVVAEIVDRLRIAVGDTEEAPAASSLTVMSDIGPHTLEKIAFQMLSLVAEQTSTASEAVETRVDSRSV